MADPREPAGQERLSILYSFPHPIGAPGIGWTAWNQVDELVRAGHRVHLVTSSVARPIEGLASRTTTLGVAGLRLPHRLLGGVDRAYAWHDRVTARAVQRREIDVVHAWPLAARRTFAAAAARGIPAVREVPNTHTAHAYDIVAEELSLLGLQLPPGASHAFNAARLREEEQEWSSATAMLTPSDAVARTFLDRGYEPDRLLRHRYGYRPTIGGPPRTARDSRPFTAVFLGRGEPRKGLHYALRAWLASSASEHGRFVVYGSFVPGYRESLEMMLAHPSVEVAGFTDDAMGALGAADVLMLPSIEEGSALVTYEAQAAGCVPLVSTAAGAVLEHGVQGLLHEPRDVATLTRQLDLLSSDPAVRERMRAEAIRHSVSLTWAAATEDLVAAYRQASALVNGVRMPAPSDLAVIVCSRERADMLEHSLASIVAATPSEVEILVVDSASTTTATREVADAAGVRYVRSDVKGLSIARNLGLESTRREIVLYTDDDCRALDGWVASILAHFDDTSVGAVTGRMLDHTLVDREGGGDGRVRLTRTVSGLDGGHGALMAFRRAMVQRLGGFDDVLGAGRDLAGAEDLDMFCRVLAAGSALVHDEDSVVHHVNTREGDAYTALHHGYGLGLGALANKWIRLRLTVGIQLTAVLLKRTTVRAMRNMRHPRRGPAERAMLRGIASGFFRAAVMRLDGERFVDDRRPPAVTPVPSGRAALQ